VVREGVGAGGEMTQALDAHMNNKKKGKKIYTLHLFKGQKFKNLPVHCYQHTGDSWVPVDHAYNPSYLGG
jgi:hypothetical protein